MSDIDLHDETLKHYGYDHDSTAPTLGFWPNDRTLLDQRLGMLPKVLKLYEAEKKKIRVVFDYDPDYPRAMLQIWGLQLATLPPDMGTRGEKSVR